jgi:signal transduction histidine kinase/DNA-binding NarL/FixJ family response regulator
MDGRDEEKRLQLANKKLEREVRRLNKDIALLREANEQAAYTQAYIKRETERQMFYIEQLMRWSPNLLILTDDQLNTVITSDLYFEYNSSYGRSEIHRGVPLRDAMTGMFPEQELDMLIDRCRVALAGESVKPIVLHRTNAAQQQFLRGTISRMSKGDEVVGLNIILADTSELMEALERAESADRAKSNFLAKMSHEIRTPINAILGLNEVILRDSRERDTVAYAADIQNAGKTLLSLINDILDFSKIEEGKMEILPTQYELGSVINDLVNMTRSRAEKKGLSFYIFVDETTPHMLFGDEIRIRQCALNLLTNAVKYTDEGSVTLTIGYDEVDTETIRLRITVADTGIGIKPEDMENLTTPFARMEESKIRSIEGTGLGLAITKQLLSLMGTELRAESIYGEGSEFSFSVEQPVVKWWPIGKFDGRYEMDGSRSGEGRLSFCAPEAQILVVDDTPVNLSVVKGLLKKTQIRVDTAESGREAIVMASRQHYDVALIDHMMPEMDGMETMRELKKLPQAAETVFIALTANAISGSREMYIGAGFHDYLSKPVDSEKLEEMLMKYLPPAKVELREEFSALSQENALREDGAEEVLPDWLENIDELDAQSGLERCGTEETYLETLGIYAKTAASCADEIDGYRRSGALDNVITKVHAIKSTSRVIGAEALSALAEKLELAGKAGDADTLLGGLDGLLARFRALGERLLPLTKKKDEKKAEEAMPPISEEELQELYGMLRQLLAELEYDRAAAMIDLLDCHQLPEQERERVDALKRAAEDFEWDRLDELLP